jgi:hypothetical protein
VNDYWQFLPMPSQGAFNAEFSPHVTLAAIDRTPDARHDTVHFNREGAAAAALELRRLMTAGR